MVLGFVSGMIEGSGLIPLKSSTLSYMWFQRIRKLVFLMLWIIKRGMMLDFGTWDFIGISKTGSLLLLFLLLIFIQAHLPRGVGSDSLCCSLNGNGKFDTRSFYNELRTTPNSIFPWKGIWKAKVPKRVAFFLWTVAQDCILTLDNLMLRGCPLANRCCMCRCNGESMDHLLIQCHVANS